MAKKKTDHYSGIGGQAVLEGIMMKNKDTYSIAIRKPNGRIDVKKEEYISKGADAKWKQLPFIRGVFNFVDSMILGISCINYSASFYEEEEQEETGFDRFVSKLFGEQAEKAMMTFSTILSVLLALALFVALPYYLSGLLGKVIASETLVLLLEGVIRLLIFLLYVVAIALMKDIRRLYQYHGAEHKCINCIEKGKLLTIENVKKSSRLHKRCGTSFLLFVMFVSIILFFFIRIENPLMRVVVRILLIPVIAGISYELIRLAGKSNNILVRIISAPGLLLQKLTTKEPDEDMILVAIAAIEAVFDWKEFFQTEFDYNVDTALEVAQMAKLLESQMEQEENVEDEDLEQKEFIEESSEPETLVQEVGEETAIEEGNSDDV